MRTPFDFPIVMETLRRVWDVTERGLEPAVLMGWRQYGELHRLLRDEPDDRRLTGFCSLRLVMVPAEDFWAVAEPSGALHAVDYEPLSAATALAEAERILGL